jgi:transposase
MSETFKNFVGIDVSKKHLDAALIVNQRYSTPLHLKFSNDASGFADFARWLKKQDVALDQSLVLVIEHTGLYQNLVVGFCATHHIALCAEQANQIRWSLGLQRGKSDKLDAARIALYGFKNRDTIVSQAVPPAAIGQIKRLLAARERLVNARKQLLTSVQELKGFVDEKEVQMLEKMQAPAVKKLEAAIHKSEAAIDALIKSDEAMHTNYKLVLSIKGVGKITAWSLIVYTCNFTRYVKGKQLACYCGVVPFKHESGSSIKGKSRVSHMANKDLKVLLHMGAVSAIQHDANLKQYYQRKVAEGKHRMSALNAVRNKLVLRICAVVERQTPYVENYQRNVA